MRLANTPLSGRASRRQAVTTVSAKQRQLVPSGYMGRFGEYPPLFSGTKASAANLAASFFRVEVKNLAVPI
jgi:hypothetical protein